MAKTIQFKRGTTAQVNAFVGALGEVVVDTNKDVIVVHDGVTAGGFPAAARANTDGSVSILSKTGSSLAEIPSTGLFNNTLTATNTNQALTAAQGKVLQDTKLNISDSIGIGQTHTQFTAGANRVANTVYTNTTGRPILVYVSVQQNASYAYHLEVDGMIVSAGYQVNVSGRSLLFGFIPNNSTYKVFATAGVLDANTIWVELR